MTAPVANYDLAIKLDPKYAAAFTERGNTNALRGRIERALSDYDQAIRFNPTYAGVFNSRAALYQAQGRDRPSALADLDMAIKLEPALGDGAQHPRPDHQQKGDIDRAIADFTPGGEGEPGLRGGLAQSRSGPQEQGRARQGGRRLRPGA